MKSTDRRHLPFAAILSLVAILAIVSVLFPGMPPTAQAQNNDPPARPTGLTGTVTHDQVSLRWDNPQDDTIKAYRILRRNKDTDDPGVFHIHVGSTGSAATSYVDSAVEAETRYVYRIKARNANGLSPRSRWFDATTPAAPPPTEPETQDPPAKPTGLTSAVTHDSVALSWDDPQDDSITGYRILRLNRTQDDLGDFHAHVDTTDTTATSYTDTDVEPEQRYVYAIKALNADGASPQSTYADADTPAAPVPAAPTNLLTAASHNQVMLNWDNPDDNSITGYRVLRGPDADNLTTLVENTGNPATTYRDTSVEPETTYLYALRARNSAGESNRSETAQVTTSEAPGGLTPARSTHGVCSRTDEVEAAIVAAVSGVSDCGDITTTHLENIAALDLFNKGIASLQSGDFDGLTALTTLNLSSNSLESLPADVFDDPTALTTLNLSSNSLESLPADVFDGLTALTTLHLSSNSLESLPADVFDGLTALTTLRLNNNSLESLPADVFDGLTALTTLEFERNALETLPADVFDGLTALEILSLSRNSLESLPADVFDGLTALERLTLDGNDLETLPPGIFEDLTALLRVLLHANTGSATFIPTANAGEDQLVELGAAVTLDGSASSGGPWGANVTHSWVKTNGADVTLDGADTTMPTFTAPGARDDLVFTLTVTGRGVDDNDAPYTHSAAARVEVREDIMPPSLQTATVNAASLTLTYDEDLDASSAPAAGAYMVTVNNAMRPLAAASPVSIMGRTVTLTLASPVEYGDTVTLTYTIPDTNPVQDPEPNSAPGFTDQEVTNNTITAPGALAGLFAIAGNLEVLLIWQAPTSGGQVEIYEYRYAQGSTVPPETDWNDAGTTTRFVVESLTNDRLHAFEVRAKNRSATGPAASVTQTPIDIPQPVVSLSQADYTARERENASVTITVNVSNLSTREVRVQVSTITGTATTPLDFSNLFDRVTFTPGPNPQTSQTRRIPIQNDQIYEHDETFTVKLSKLLSPGDYTISDDMGEATVTIYDDDPKPTARISDASVQEGGEIEFTVRSTTGNACVSAVPFSVDWAVTIESGDTASADDLTLADGTLSLSRCRIFRTITVQTTHDILDETHETFTITLSAPVDALLPDDPTATGTILDNDDAPSGPTNLEASVGDTRVILSWDASTTAGTQPITHHEYRSRTNITDYGDAWTPIPDSVPTGNNAASYRITGLDNQTPYTFQVRAVSTAGPSGAATSNQVTPIPAIIEFVEMTQSVGEGEVALQITLKASHPPASHITVSLSYAAPESGTAADLDDYRQGPTSIVFTPNSVEQSLNIVVTEDQKVEPTESLHINIDNAPGATIGDQSNLRVDILDNDVGLIRIARQQMVTPEGEPIQLTVQLTCPNPVNTNCNLYADLTITYTIAAGTADEGDDYTPPDSLEVFIPIGGRTATITIPTVDDQIDDDDETFTVTLTKSSIPGSYAFPTGPEKASTVTIRDNDTRGVTVHPTELHVPETRNATYTVVLDTEPTGNVTVTPSLAAGGDQDITLQSTAALTFTPDNWRQPQSVQVNAADDADEVNGQRVINHTVAGADYASETGPTVTAKEVDDEINIPASGEPSSRAPRRSAAR